MKPMHKGLLASLVLAAAGLTVWSAAAGRLHEAAADEGLAPSGREKGDVAEGGGARAGGAAAAAEGSATADSQARDAAATGTAGAPAGRAPRTKSHGESVAAPADMKVTVRDTPAGRTVRVRRPGHLIAVGRGADRRVGMHEVIWTAQGGGDGQSAEALAWESTSPRTLETLRGRLSVGADGAAAVSDTVRAYVVSEDAKAHHRCAGHEDGEGGFVVLCRVEGAAAAASVDGGDPRQGVWSLAGETTLVRLDLPMSGDGAAARVLGYEKGGKGVLVRAEASRAPGEAEAVLALGSDDRAQPRPIRRFGCFCRLPPDDRL